MGSTGDSHNDESFLFVLSIAGNGSMGSTKVFSIGLEHAKLLPYLESLRKLSDHGCRCMGQCNVLLCKTFSIDLGDIKSAVGR